MGGDSKLVRLASHSFGTSESSACRRVELRLIADESHYDEIVARGLLTAQASIWIATANIKDVHMQAPVGSRARARGRYESLFEWLRSRANSGLEVRILHASNPSRALGVSPAWKSSAALRRACPRVHLKMVAVDGRFLYLGSANFTGAGLGAKATGRRNFELGIVTEDPFMLDETQAKFDAIWTGKRCNGCRRRNICPAPIDTLNEVARRAPRVRRGRS